MSPINRACQPGSITIDIGLIQWIESATMVDCEPSPNIIAPLVARCEARLGLDAPDDPALDGDIDKALDPWGGILYLQEIHAIQQLRGWHRSRYGRVTVDAARLAEVRNVLDGLSLSFGEECDQTIEDYWLDRVRSDGKYRTGPDGIEVRAEVLAYLRKHGSCGECSWCHAVRLRDECDSILDAAGYYGGSRYEAYKPKAA